jgi:hypothetical protein
MDNTGRKMMHWGKMVGVSRQIQSFLVSHVGAITSEINFTS